VNFGPITRLQRCHAKNHQRYAKRESGPSDAILD
jgi:hypothetical protein